MYSSGVDITPLNTSSQLQHLHEREGIDSPEMIALQTLPQFTKDSILHGFSSTHGDIQMHFTFSDCRPQVVSAGTYILDFSSLASILDRGGLQDSVFMVEYPREVIFHYADGTEKDQSKES